MMINGFEKREERREKRFPLPVFLFSLLPSLFYCSKPPQQQVPPVPVQTVPVSKIAAPLTVEANGVVEPAQTVMVQAQVGGTIQEVAFAEGQDVGQGQVLFRLDPRPFEAALRQAEATLARDEANAANAQREAERYKTL